MNRTQTSALGNGVGTSLTRMKKEMFSYALCYRIGVADERSVSRVSLNLLLKIGLEVLLGRRSLWVLNHSGIITALKSSCTEIPRCLASVSRRVNVCGPKATITLTDVWFQLNSIRLSRRGPQETFGDVWIPDYTKYGKEYKPAGKGFPENGTIATSCP